MHLYACTLVHLYTCTPVHLYTCTTVQLNNCTIVQLYNCTIVQLYNCTIVQLYNCALTSRGRSASSSAVPIAAGPPSAGSAMHLFQWSLRRHSRDWTVRLRRREALGQPRPSPCRCCTSMTRPPCGCARRRKSLEATQSAAGRPRYSSTSCGCTCADSSGCMFPLSSTRSVTRARACWRRPCTRSS